MGDISRYIIPWKTRIIGGLNEGFAAGDLETGKKLFEFVEIFRYQRDISLCFFERGDAMVFSHIAGACVVGGQSICEAGAARMALGKT